MWCGERAGNQLAPGGGQEPCLVALVLTGNPVPHLPSHLSVLTLLLSPHPSAATSEGSRGGRARAGSISPWEGSSGARHPCGGGAEPGSPTSNRRMGRSCVSSCHHDMDKAKAMLPLLDVAWDRVRGCRTGSGSNRHCTQC